MSELPDESIVLKGAYLHPGMLFASYEPHAITTVLGSCVSVCLWDSRLLIGGMNHYLLPLWNGEGLSSPKYGNIAIRKLMDKMLSLGSEKKDLRAKLFGGASLMGAAHPLLDIGGRNIQLAIDMLQDEGMRLISSDLGSDRGRKVIFNTYTGIARVKRLGVLGSRACKAAPDTLSSMRD